MTVKRKSIPRQIAEHFGCDMDDVRDASYQHGHWTPAVFSGFTGDGAYWSAGPRQPRHKDGEDGLKWTQVQSQWPGNGPLWTAKD